MRLGEMTLRFREGVTPIDVMRSIGSRMDEEITNERKIIGSFGDDQDSQSLSGHVLLASGSPLPSLFLYRIQTRRTLGGYGQTSGRKSSDCFFAREFLFRAQ